MPDSSPPNGADLRPFPPGHRAVAVLVADAHPVVRAGVRAILAAEPGLAVVGETGDGPGAVEMARRLNADVVVCDTPLLQFDGLGEAGARVLVLTGCDAPRTMREVLAGGASGYVLKRATGAQLVQAVRVVAAGGTYLDPELAGCVVDGFVGPGTADAVELSDREEQVIRLIAQGYSNKEIAAQLRLSVKTVETYKARSMDKLKVRTRVGLVAFAARRGWLSAAGRAAAVG